MQISIIAAIGKNRELGKDNKLLWHIPQDLKHFKKLTQNHVVIMGRKTFQSIGKPLPKRVNIIITRNKNFSPPSCLVFNSFKKALKEAKKRERKGEVFVIGGGEIYKQAISFAGKLYLTIVDTRLPAGQENSEADTYFPDYSDFKKTIFEEKHQNDNHSYTFLELKRQ